MLRKHVRRHCEAAGQQLTMQDVTGITGYVYDLDGRQIAVQNPTGINLTYSFDSLGNRLTMQDIGGITSYAYDAQSRPLTIWNPLNEITTMAYDALDREYHRVLANGGTISHTWDANGRETLIQNISAAGIAQAVFTNSYSANNNRLTVADLDGTLVSYGYDASSQLTLEQRSGSTPCNISYTYDPNANRLTMSSSGAVTAYQYNSANEQILITPSTGAPTTQTFDTVGNLTLQNTGGALTTQTWSPENRMLSIANPDGTGEQNTYSADGLRKSKTSSGSTTNFTWDNQNLLLETNTSNVVLARYTDFPGFWGGLASQNRSGVSSFYLYDTQGSVRNLASILGAITDAYIYTAFGVELLASGSTVNAFRYVGLYGYYREYADVYYVRARWLDALKGRWDSWDPIGIVQWQAGEHPYGYAWNNPVVYTDPTGLSPNLPDPKPCVSDETCAMLLTNPDNGGGGGEILRLSASCCYDCAKSIANTWINTRWHDCNHNFAHCLACCYLSRYVDPSCASSAQWWQNRHQGGSQVTKENGRKYRFGPDKSAACRTQACDSGIEGSKSHSSCYDYCTQKWPFDGGRTCSSEGGSKVDCKGVKLNLPPPVPEGCKKSV